MPAHIWLRMKHDVDPDRIEYHRFRNVEDAALWLMEQIDVSDLSENDLIRDLKDGVAIEDGAYIWELFTPNLTFHD